MNVEFVCPAHLTSALVRNGADLICSEPTCHHHSIENAYPNAGGVPILISSALCDTVCDPEQISNGKTEVPGADGKTFHRKVMRWLRYVIQGKIQVTEDNCIAFVQKVRSAAERPKVLIIGGAERGQGTKALWDDTQLERTSTDIYWSPTVDVICDGHYLPFRDATFHGVWIQAVLEHVMDPPVVVSQIHRVLKDDGYVYAETPFMQQVHSGAYDFTRFTVLGHRYLFRDFKMISIGGTVGAHVVLRWSLRSFTRAIFPNKILFKLSDIFWGLILWPFKYLIRASSLYDSASGSYFFGQKSNTRVTHAEVIALYRGDG